MASEKIQGILDTIGTLSVLEFNVLVKELQKQWGVTPVVATSGVTPPVIPEPEVDTADPTYRVVLQAAGPLKIRVIQVIRELLPNLGLREARDFVDGAPVTVAEELSPENADKIFQMLSDAGAKAEIVEVV